MNFYGFENMYVYIKLKNTLIYDEAKQNALVASRFYIAT